MDVSHVVQLQTIDVSLTEDHFYWEVDRILVDANGGEYVDSGITYIVVDLLTTLEECRK